MFDKEYVIDNSIFNSIPGMIAEWNSKRETFNQLKETVPEILHESLAKKVAAYVDDRTKERNKWLVYFIFFINFFCLMIGTSNFVFNLRYMQNRDFLIIIYILINIILIWLYFGIIRFKLFAFTTAVSLYSIGLIFSLFTLLLTPSWLLIQGIISNAASLIYIHLLRKRLFPEITFWGNVNRNKKKEFTFST